MTKHGKKLIFDVSTGNLREVELTEAEIAQREIDEQNHLAEQAELAKTQYLRDRETDPMWPTQKEKTDALFEFNATGNRAKMDDIQKRIKTVEAKYPAPQ